MVIIICIICFTYLGLHWLCYIQVKEGQPDGQAYRYVVDKKDVKERVGELLKRQDLSKYVL